ncbi:F1F0 ATP synthase subunit 4 KNAG_0A01920 [Huiozyma naganishii CBS 8797]|uniref:ATP synthase subunit 4 n=1 Tax=Huiozyma naganishii (strain ATCC MYA-139 / BCRC 22969 / CBS 8797 / KCTC 17520 / NBRC 10181 / NCYC 3082 / Yp74L-3) TaxID=1071383 RepID=J7S398_HUIN7|nr:hypothetical protein KNAG_0A01920 [Kazachstania naganishii CBS 8797]CCK67881.1 hypothetical protein KNAG_0A01920 [Kazachstania naganishii CBS 8797]
MSLRALALRPTARVLLNRSAVGGTVRCFSVSTRVNSKSGVPEDPKTKAQSIIDALPGNSVLSKTGILGTSAAAAIYAISNELYVINEESILLLSFLTVGALMAKFAAPAYNTFAEARMKKVADVLNASRERHVSAVKERIDSVSELTNVSQITKVLFDVSKETVELEAKAFELKQKVDLAQHARSVLDSWVRYEASLRQLEQRKTVEALIAKVQSELDNPKFQDKILQQSIADVEKVFSTLK